MVLSFCNVCKNIMIQRENTSNLDVLFECLSCHGNTPLTENVNKNIIYKESKSTYEYPLNLNTKYDRTLMRVQDQECKNPDCPSKNNSKKPLVISYSRNKDLIQGYMCTECDSCWY